MTNNYDIGVLGGGPGGYVAAIRASQLGADVALVEENKLGGACLNRGCIPTKTYLKHAKLIAEIKNSEKYGININGEVNPDWNKMKKRKDKVVNKLTSGVKSLLDNSDVDIFFGTGQIMPEHKILIYGDEKTEIICDNLLIASGSTPFRPDISGIKSDNVITSGEALDMPSLPDELLILGGGVIGVEMADIFHGFGVEVKIIEIMDSILPEMDQEIASLLQRSLRKKGMGILVDRNVEKIKDLGDEIKAILADGQEISGDKLLVAAGRKANMKGLNDLDLIRENGFLQVDNYYWTGVGNIYAVGDVIGNNLLAHEAFEEGVAAVENMLENKKRSINYSNVPKCIYTIPAAASVGLQEMEARKKCEKIKIGRFPFSANGKALAEGEDEGFVKIISNRQGEIMGAHILGSGADEMINEFTISRDREITANYLGNIIHPHPSLSEAVKEAALDVDGLALHSV